MLMRHQDNLLVTPADIAPIRDDMKVIGTFNAGAIDVDGEVVLLVRVAQTALEGPIGQFAVPRWHEGELTLDWFRSDEFEFHDPRVAHRCSDGLVRLTHTSHLQVVRSRDGRTIDRVENVRFCPEEPWEQFGVEDPRITKIEDRYYITYVAVSKHGVCTALASTDDFQTFERHGVIFCPENKDVVLFPEKIHGKYVCLHRPAGRTPLASPEMWVAESDDLIHWGRHQYLFSGTSDWETGRTGAGAPPIRTDRGWLEIYHGNRRPQNAKDVGTYSAGAMLLDLENPAHVLCRTEAPIFVPEQSYETEGFVPNVVFPTAVVERGDRLLVYYGAADTSTAVVELSRDELLGALCDVCEHAAANNHGQPESAPIQS